MTTTTGIPKRYVTLSAQWHSGQASMLYAVASSGNLRRGTSRPWNYEADRHATDSEWNASLWRKLTQELENALSRAQHSRYPEIGQDAGSLGMFLRFASKRAAYWDRLVKRESKPNPIAEAQDSA